MPKHWVYVLACENNRIYVGETTRLYRRLLEHVKGTGGKNTHMYAPLQLIGLYSVHQNVPEPCKDFRDFEDFITELIMCHKPDTWFYVHGGKYTRYKETSEDIIQTIMHVDSSDINIRHSRHSGHPMHSRHSRHSRHSKIDARPFCHCGLPCERKVNEIHKYVYYCCSKHNIWTNMVKFFKSAAPSFCILDDPCDYYGKVEEQTDQQIRASCVCSSDALQVMQRYPCAEEIFQENSMKKKDKGKDEDDTSSISSDSLTSSSQSNSKKQPRKKSKDVLDAISRKKKKIKKKKIKRESSGSILIKDKFKFLFREEEEEENENE